MSSSLLSRPSEHEVHVWQWNLDAPGSNADRYRGILSTQEHERASRFRFERHRNRFVAGRGELRLLLGRYLGMPPRDVGLDYGSDGKPFCTTQPPEWQLCFNLSHSEDAAALAVSNGFEIGIDIELARPIGEDVPLEVFSNLEREQFVALPDVEQQQVFLESWARKEACLKALGTGFMLPPTHFEFDLCIRGDTTPRFVGGDAQEAAHWQVRAITANAARACAVAARRIGWSIVVMN
jgi:4'-phosphopantetheinyl transferase